MSFAIVLGAAEGSLLDARVDYQDGMLSMTFDRTPVIVAVQEIGAKTGIEIVLPAVAQRETVTLRVDRLPLEAALRYLLRALGLESFVLVYDRHGEARQLIALGPEKGGRPSVLPAPSLLSGSGEPCPPNCPSPGAPTDLPLPPGSPEPCPPACPPMQSSPPNPNLSPGSIRP